MATLEDFYKTRISNAQYDLLGDYISPILTSNTEKVASLLGRLPDDEPLGWVMLDRKQQIIQEACNIG